MQRPILHCTIANFLFVWSKQINLTAVQVIAATDDLKLGLFDSQGEDRPHRFQLVNDALVLTSIEPLKKKSPFIPLATSTAILMASTKLTM